MPDTRAPNLEALGGHLRELAARGSPRRWRRGSLLIEEGEHGDELYIILSGRLRVFSRDEREREITHGHYGPGEYVGEMSLDGGPRSASVECVEPATGVLVTRHQLLAYIAERPEFALELLAKVIRRARAATLNAKQLALNDVYGRLRQLLNSLAAQPAPHGRRRIAARPTHQEMAAQLGCSREMVSRLLKDLTRGGYLELDDRGLLITRELPMRW
jgi:CRP/FNR family cyclic AMP-dependent transcriptional regulator